MKKVITYGTFDLLHYGHLRLLERAKSLGDYLIVGVTADNFDLARGKINVQQSLMQRIEAVRATGLADEIIVEEYEGQKIEDIKRFDIDIFTVGSDWKGKFDYLKEFCQVVYLERTVGVSSSEIRSENRDIRIGIVGESGILNKFEKESRFVNGLSISGVYSNDVSDLSDTLQEKAGRTEHYDQLLEMSDAVYIASHPSRHYAQIEAALKAGKHVICESPIATNTKEFEQLESFSIKKGLILMDVIKTAYSTAYSRMLLLVKSGLIGEVKSVDTVCTSLSDLERKAGKDLSNTWNSICAWGPTAMLPIFQILGTDYLDSNMVSHVTHKDFDSFTKIDFVYPHAVASIKVGKGVKSEGELVVAGTKGYVYVPAPWWKTDYFEIRYENPVDNKRYFYQLDGEGIRYAIVTFLKSIQMGRDLSYMEKEQSEGIVKQIEQFYQGNYCGIM